MDIRNNNKNERICVSMQEKKFRKTLMRKIFHITGSYHLMIGKLMVEQGYG